MTVPRFPGDLGVFFLFAAGGGLHSLQTDIQNLVPGTVVLYKTNESENGLKLATVMKAGQYEKKFTTHFSGNVLHLDVSLEVQPPPVSLASMRICLNCSSQPTLESS